MRTVPFGAGGAIPRLLFRGRRATQAALRALVAAAVLLGSSPTPVCADPVQLVRAVIGNASWYGPQFAWHRTASGERFDPRELTGAHRTLPFGSRVRVTNLRNGRSVDVTINDRGPYRRRREIDLSYGAAQALGMLQRGIVEVRIELLDS